MYGHLPPITKTIKIRRATHVGHCWRSRDELISNVLLWTPSRGRAKAGRPARTLIQQLCVDTGCSPEDLPEAMDDWERVVREGQGYPCWWHDMMMMMMMMIVLKIAIFYFSNLCTVIAYQEFLSNLNDTIITRFQVIIYV